MNQVCNWDDFLGINKVNTFKFYSALLVTSHFAVCRKDSLYALACKFCISRKGGTEGSGLGHLQVAARLGCESSIIGTRWANSLPGCMDRLRKRYSHFAGGSFLARQIAWALSGCMTTKSADYCMLVNEWAWWRPLSESLKSFSWSMRHHKKCTHGLLGWRGQRHRNFSGTHPLVRLSFIHISHEK